MPAHAPTVLLAMLLGLLSGCADHRQTTRPEPLPKTPNIIEQYWPDGSLKLRRHVRRDADGKVVNHGPYTRWYDNGLKEYEVVLVMGNKHGSATRWHRNGRKWFEEHYRHGKRHGPSFMWDTEGTKRKEEHHFNGKPHGTWTTWDDKGRVKWQGTFEHGTPVHTPLQHDEPAD